MYHSYGDTADIKVLWGSVHSRGCYICQNEIERVKDV